MKRFLLALLPILLISAADTPQKAYVEKFAAYAVNEMYRSGIPASITLAQGMLESRYGLSRLAVEGNNHFGIKCHDWKGATIKEDDETRGECFRAYDSAYQSFQDHSDFLRYRPRYHALFDNDITDYKSWAYGLSKAGYATDPQYPAKLIKLIEENDLARFDTMKPSDFEPVAQIEEEEVAASTPDKTERKAKVRKVRRRAAKAAKSEPAVEEVLPESPAVLEEPRPAANEEFSFPLARKVYTQNGVPFIYAERGDTYASLAKSYNLFLKEILAFNDLEASEALLPGTQVYLQAKKKQTRKGLDKYIVEEDGESLRDICQHFGVKKSAIVKLNAFSSTHRLREGDTILLRK